MIGDAGSACLELKTDEEVLNEVVDLVFRQVQRQLLEHLA